MVGFIHLSHYFYGYIEYTGQDLFNASFVSGHLIAFICSLL